MEMPEFRGLATNRAGKPGGMEPLGTEGIPQKGQNSSGAPYPKSREGVRRRAGKRIVRFNFKISAVIVGNFKIFPTKCCFKCARG